MTRVAASDTALAQRLGIPCGDADLVVEFAAGRLQLRDTRPGAPGPVWADFESAGIETRREAGRGLLLAKAIGVKKGVLPTVLDATAGLGRDAYTLAALGCDVTAVERSAVVAALLADAIDRSAGDPAAERITLHVGDARDITGTRKFEVVYLDPMFPERRKSAQVKKEMQYMQALLGDEDGAELFEPALQCARRRVVVKRPIHAPLLAASPAPSHVLKGKSVRFDVYACG
jgi:16S rRNA (guanine1516-N2)-methyltransferase